MIVDALKLGSNTNKVSLLKTLSWRLIGTIDTMCISYFLTGNIDIALSIGGIEVISKMALYYVHERAWVRLLKKQA